MHPNDRLDAQLLLWPSLPSGAKACLLDFGTLGGTIYRPGDHSWAFPAEPQQELSYTASFPLTQMLPRLRASTGVDKMRITEGSINESLRYLATISPDSWVSDDIVREYLKESIEQEQSLDLYDPFRGELLAKGMFAGLPMIATPMGESANELGLTLIQHKPNRIPNYNFLAPRSTSISFPSRILQIATVDGGAGAITDAQIIVRTKESVSILQACKNIPDEISRVEADHVEVLDMVPCVSLDLFQDQTIDAAISPYIPNQYALIGDQGRVAIWTRKNNTRNSILFANSPMAGESLTSDTGGEESAEGGNGRINKKSRRRQNLDTVPNEKALRLLEEKAESKWRAESGTIVVVRKAPKTKQQQDIEDPWRVCTWGAHPSQLILASRTDIRLIDFRTATPTETILFQPTTGESVTALEQCNPESRYPFQRFIVTTHQIACIDQRLPQRPLISWAHQSPIADPPRGIQILEMEESASNSDEQITTVLTWSQRDATVTAHAICFSKSGGKGMGLIGGQTDHNMTIFKMGRDQELASFHSHPYYANSNKYRPALHRWTLEPVAGGRGGQKMQMDSNKPQLLGMGVISAWQYMEEDEEEDEDAEEGGEDMDGTNAGRYSATGAIYSQQVEVKKKAVGGTDASIDGDRSATLSEYELAIGKKLGGITTRSSSLSSLPATVPLDSLDLSATTDDGDDMDALIDQLLADPEQQVATWKKGVKEAQVLADEADVSNIEIRTHHELDIRGFWEFIKVYAGKDREVSPQQGTLDLERYARQAVEVLMGTMPTAVTAVSSKHQRHWQQGAPVTMMELLRMIKCSDYSMETRKAVANRILSKLDGMSLDTALSSSHTTSRKVLVYKVKNSKAIQFPVSEFYSDQGPGTSNNAVDADGVSRVVRSLLKMYPLPMARHLGPASGEVSEEDDEEEEEEDLIITAGLAKLSLPRSRRTSNSSGTIPVFSGVWPTFETQGIRNRTIHRLAQDLEFASTVITVEKCDTEPGTRKSDMDMDLEDDLRPSTLSISPHSLSKSSGIQSVFRFLNKPPPLDNTMEPLSEKITSGPKLKLPSRMSDRARHIWQEWDLGSNPDNYHYQPPENIDASQLTGGEDMQDDDEDPEVAKAQEERLLALRRRRERKEERVHQAKAYDAFRSVGGSVSQPAAMFMGGMDVDGEEAGRHSLQSRVDEDGMMSAPTISTSQPSSSSLLRAAAALQARRTTAGNAAKRSSTGISLTQPSLPSALKRESSLSFRREPSLPPEASGVGVSTGANSSPVPKIKTKTPKAIRHSLSQDHAIFQPNFVSSSQDWEDSLASKAATAGTTTSTVASTSASVPTPSVSFSQFTTTFSNNQLPSSSLTSEPAGGMSLSQQSQEPPSLIGWGASQPVPGVHANRKPAAGPVKKKKPKNRSQGF